MPLWKTGSSTSTYAISTLNEKAWDRNRRQTDPLISEPLELVPCNTRRSIDSTFKLPNSRRPNLFTFTSNHSSSLSSDSFSNPVLANFSPRKISGPLASPARKDHSSPIPTLHLQTPRAARDPDSPSPSAVSSNNNRTTTSIRYPRSNSLSPISPSNNKPVAAKEPKSPHLKRSPASRSSLGIETSSGPPPALSTRKRNSAQDKPVETPTKRGILRKPKSFNTVGAAQEPKTTEPSPTPNIDEGMKGESQVDPEKGRKLRSSLPARMNVFSREKDKLTPTSPQVSTNNHHSTPNGDGSMKEETNTDPSSRESGTESKSEDLFLNIARTTSNRRNSGPRTERRRSKFGLTGLSSRPRTVEETPSPERDMSHMTAPLSQDNSPLGSYGTTSAMRSPSSAHPLDETGRSRYFGGAGSRSSVGAPRSRLGRTHREMSPESPQTYVAERRDSVHEQPQSRPYRPSNLSGSRTTSALAGSDATERIRPDMEKYKHEGTESTLSTTAPSTVWDELDDLKSRIWKLELTGKFPASSAAAMSTISGERPRTATTTVTTLSSSPKHGRKGSSPPPEPESNPIHPLLHTALAKAKPMLSPEVYHTLEATAADALNLANMLSSNAPQLASSSMSVVSVSGTSTSDRQLRRKADNMCRSLTELCLALSDEQLNSVTKPRPGSRDAASKNFHLNGAETESTTPTITYPRSASHEPEDIGRGQASFTRDVPSQRLEHRRTSMLNLSSSTSSNHTIRGSRDISDNQTVKLSTPPQRINRSSTVYRSRRPEEEEFNDQSQTTSRPLPRAVTDIHNSGNRDRYSAQDRISREYVPSPSTSQYQNVQEESPYQRTPKSHAPSSSQSAIPLRRTYTSNLPTTSHIQPGFRRYGATGSNIGSGSQVSRTPAENTNSSPRDDYSQQPRTAARTASHYGSLEQLRSRTNSLGTRRIGIRQRPLTGIPNGTAEEGR